ALLQQQSADPVRELAEEQGAAVQSGDDAAVQRGIVLLLGRIGQQQVRHFRGSQGDPPVAPGEGTGPRPDHLTGGGQLVQQGRRVAGEACGQHQRLQGAGRHRYPGELLDHRVHLVGGGGAPPSPTGSISLRSRASEARRSLRSTSASQYSSAEPPPASSGRSSPRTSWPVPVNRSSALCTTATPRPNRRAAASAVNGPRLRAYRMSSSPSGSAVGSVNASGTPTGSATPSASRTFPASSTGIHRSSPAMRTCSTRRCAASSANHS